MGVVVLRWPDEQREAERLSTQGIPHLLLVSPGEPPPQRDVPLEDWIRLPADDRDILARMTALERRAAALPARPELDQIGRVTYRARWVTLSPIERQLMGVLVDHFGDLVSAEELATHAWPTHKPTGNALRVHLTRLRQRIAPLGLEVVTVREHGFVLQEIPREDVETPP